ncbi:lysozyme inhibitor LprI family protein [Lutimaribacter marinistellae]|uniref:Lysozyme inhibitor LprI family protein n=1 Tax=Lutimaribacter marinistellae TaxID=1820329 RepID=A0ABV7TKQ8_9RHOB
MRLTAAFSTLAAIFATALPAEQLDCNNPKTQLEMTGCASQAYEAADRDLNASWPGAMDMARRLDQSLQPGQTPAAEILRDAQRKWIAFRDAACTAESLVARGGSMQNQLFFICMERLTRQRTRELREFGRMN